MPKLPPDQRWRIATADPECIQALGIATGLPPLLAQVLSQRDITTPDQAQAFCQPETVALPSPLEEFEDLGVCVDFLCSAIEEGEAIGICGDYDADGMTSTALLIRALRHLGGEVQYAIPSRMQDGYGINKKIVQEFAEAGIGLILTVDNGIAALEPIQLAVELGVAVIITDHHDLPPQLPPADAILNPKQLLPTSPYAGLAGVGVAYILAVETARALDRLEGLTQSLLELFTLGTIADLAPLVGVNRRWLRRGLGYLPQSQLPGVQALIQVSGVQKSKSLRPDDIGFRLGPRINAIGRIGDPGAVIELLTTDDPGVALERAMQCEQTNQRRQALCEQIEAEALAAIAAQGVDWRSQRVLVLHHAAWHHGVIGIVASRLLERFGVPAFLCCDEAEGQIRGSARGIPEFHVFAALEACADLLTKHGGHQAAGGFSLAAQNFPAFQQRLSEFAHQCLQPEHLKPLVEIDAQATFSQLTLLLYQQIDALQPWGIGNREPHFWTPNVRLREQRIVTGNHLKLTLEAVDEAGPVTLRGIAWRWGEYFPLPPVLDLAYKLRRSVWQDTETVELELVGARWPAQPERSPLPESPPALKKATFIFENRRYQCSLRETEGELRIRNPQGKVLAVQRGQRVGLLGTSRDTAQEVSVTEPPYRPIVEAAVAALQALP